MHDNEVRDRPFDEWPSLDAFLACRWDGNYKRVQLLARGAEFLENLNASELLSNGQDGVAEADRKFALLAIDEARKSVSEDDTKPHPKVGAVVVKNGKVLSAAHRGEIRGNHAEYIALEKKLSDEVVVGANRVHHVRAMYDSEPPKSSVCGKAS